MAANASAAAARPGRSAAPGGRLPRLGADEPAVFSSRLRSQRRASDRRKSTRNGPKAEPLPVDRWKLLYINDLSGHTLRKDSIARSTANPCSFGV
jgi:hypothetical protein